MVSNNKCNNKIKYIGSNIISERNINLEIFRILSILLVITLHILGHGNFLESTELFSFNYYTLSLLQSLSFVAVNCFVLISGYFLVKSQFKFNKVLNLLSVIFFYSSILTFIVWKFNLVEVSLKDFIYSVLPITSNRYWFATSYVLLYLISPFLNSSINKMTRLELKKLIIALIILFSVIPTFTFYVDGFGVNNGYGLIWFICLYTVSSYLRLYYEPNHKKNKWIIYYFMICSILFLTKIFISKLSISIIGRLTGSMIFFKYNSILVFLASVFLFLYFLNLKISSKIIIRISLFLSPLSFGVYLVHDQIGRASCRERV